MKTGHFVLRVGLTSCKVVVKVLIDLLKSFHSHSPLS